MKESEIVKAIAVANKACGGVEIDCDVMRIFVNKLERRTSSEILRALDKCIDEVKGQLAVRDIIQRIKIEDGRPGPDEAWAMVPKDENSTAVWTDEMAIAWRACQSLLPNQIAARMAFLESYREHVGSARRAHKPVKWSASLGHDTDQRERALIEAVAKGRLSAKRATDLCPQLPPIKAPNQLNDGQAERRLKALTGGIK